MINNSKNEVPTGWKWTSLDTVADILDSQRVPVNAKEREARQGNVPYYGATGQVGFIDDYLFDEELVLLGEDGAPFFDPSKQKAYIIRGKSWVNNHAHVLRTKAGIPSSYLKYYLDIVDYHGFVTGTTRAKLNQKAMRQIPIPLAPPEQQKRIVSEIEKQFSRLDEAVANLKRVKANLKRYKAAVLKAAVEGKLTEEWRKLHPDVEPTDKLLERILAERREKWQGRGKYKESAAPDTTDLPELPEGWVWASPAQVSSGEQYSLAIGPFGSNLKVADYKDAGVPLVFVRNIRANYFGTQKAVFISNEKAEELKAHQISGGDLLITKMGDPPGDICIYPKDLSRAVITADCIKLRLSPCLDTASYFYRAIESRVVQKQILSVTKGVAQLKVSLARFKTIALPIPPVDEQRKISEEVDRCFSIIAGTEAQVASNLLRADKIRKSILKMAFSGALCIEMKRLEEG